MAQFWGDRLGLASFRTRVLDRPIPAEVGWLHTLGSIALVLVLILVATGALLTLNYSPSTEHAYHSVRYIEHEVPLGGFVRGLHHWAASFLIAAVVLHLLHSFWRFAFRRPRELTWCTGVLLLVVVLAFAFTGYLLPWDEKAYWATVVGTNLASQFPGIGTFLLQVVRGGEAVGAATLARFYGAHVALLPLLLLLLLSIHLYLVVLHGIARKRRATDTGAETTIAFWPDVAAKDAVAALLLLSVLSVLAWHTGAPLQAPADPTNTQYVPRPDWYFLPLFQLLTLFSPDWEAIGSVVIPLASVLVLAALPWAPARLEASHWGRKSLLGAATTVFAGVTALGIAGARLPNRDVSPRDPAVARGRLLFGQLGCANCHSVRGVGGIVGPDLTLIGLRRPDATWLAAHLDDPRSIVPTSPMPSFPLGGEEREDLVAFLLSLGNDLRYTPAAPDLFDEWCQVCHRLAGRGWPIGPDLQVVGRVRSVAYIHRYIEQPRAFNLDSRMPPAVGLSHEQVEDIARYVVATALGGQ